MSFAQQQQSLDVKAVAWTIGVHVLLFLIFFLINYTVPELEPMDDMGIEVNLGTAADGYGTDQPMSIGSPAAQVASAPQMSNASDNSLPVNTLESDDPEAPAISDDNTKSNTSENNAVNSNRSNANNAPSATNTPPAPKPKYQYSGTTNEGGNNANSNTSGGSEGNTTGNGDRGVPGGTPGAENYTGTPGGGGFNFDLAGRHIVAQPAPDADFKESGKVVVRITVNRAGIITNKRIISASNTQLRNIALEKVSQIRFNKSSTAAEEQFGSITFVFKTRS